MAPSNGRNGAHQPDFTPAQLSNHDSAIPLLYKVNISFMVVIDLIISLRLFVRLRMVKRPGLDDLLMVGAGLFSLAFSSMIIVATRYGLGRHEWDLPPTAVLEANKRVIQSLWICQVMYSSGLTLAKLSIISSYLRVFPTKAFRIIMYTLGTVILLTCITTIMVTIFQCTPIRGAWDFAIPAKCIAIMDAYYFSTAVNILTDLMLCTLPLPLFWKLQLPVRERVVVSILFMLGFFATAASVMRIVVLHNLASWDITAMSASTLNWSVVEVDTGIVCACVPCLKPLFKVMLASNKSAARTPKQSDISPKHSNITPSTPGTPGYTPSEHEMTKTNGKAWVDNSHYSKKEYMVISRRYHGDEEDSVDLIENSAEIGRAI